MATQPGLSLLPICSNPCPTIFIRLKNVIDCKKPARANEIGDFRSIFMQIRLTITKTTAITLKNTHETFPAFSPILLSSWAEKWARPCGLSEGTGRSHPLVNVDF
jgi:hypothetical protein